jgi:hypothetical protein
LTAPVNPGLPNPSDVQYGGVTIPGPYVSYIQTSSARYGVPIDILTAQLYTESGFNPNAKSSAGAEGIAQFLPSTAQSLGIDPWNVSQAIDGMAKLDSTYKAKFGSWDLALAAYNAGPGAVEKYNGIPPFSETQNYVKKIDQLANGGLGGALKQLPSIIGDPFGSVESVLGAATNSATWRRVGIAVLGLGVVGAGVYFAMEKEGSSVSKKLVNMV